MTKNDVNKSDANKSDGYKKTTRLKDVEGERFYEMFVDQNIDKAIEMAQQIKKGSKGSKK